MEVNRTCSQCNEEANLFCKLCSTHYCWEHPCSHLQAAHEDNSYTNRLAEDETIYDQTIRDSSNEREERSSRNVPSTSMRSGLFEERNLLSNTLQYLGSYSQTQLQEQLDYYRTQARRIRTELERRSLFASGTVQPEDWNKYLEQKFSKHSTTRRSASSNDGKRQKRNANNKSNAQIQQLLHNQIRLGNLSLEQVTQILNKETK